MSQSSSLNNDLLLRSINYHGQQLTGFLEERSNSAGSIRLDHSGLDYHLYQQRSKELRIEDRGRRMLLHRFISHNVNSLFDAKKSAVPPSDFKDTSGDVTSVLPPMETFLRVDKEDRTRHFFDIIAEGDVLFAKVAAKNNSGLMLTVLAFAEATGKSRREKR